MRIAEIYHSIQGEGMLTGVPSVFVRTSGCNLRCHFCDTPHASWHPQGEDLSVDEIVERVEAVAAPSHVVITGGEPMLFAELVPLCDRLHQASWHITIETAGTLYLPLVCDLMSISPKMSNSTPPAETGRNWRKRHERTRMAPDVVRRLLDEHPYQLKFVIESPSDCDEVEDYLKQFSDLDRERVLLMPEGVDPERLSEIADWLEPICGQRALGFCPRRQIEWFGAVRCT